MKKPEFSGRRRLLKKLCKRAHALVLRIEPRMAGEAFTSTHHERPAGWMGYGFPGWHENEVLPGTWGFGRVSGYYDPEWDDENAFDHLRDMLWDHFTVWDEPSTELRFVFPAGVRGLRNWRDVLQAGELVALEAEANRAANAARLAA